MQAQILDLLRDLQRTSRLSLILITHDLGVIAEMAERVMVMYAGRIAEVAPVAHDLRPIRRIPTREALLASRARHAPPAGAAGDDSRAPCRSCSRMPPGCRFAPRCAHRRDACRARNRPPVVALAADHEVGCLRPFGYAAPAGGAP